MRGSGHSLAAFERCGVRPSHQRVAIYGHLRGRKDHPAAETVFAALRGSMPTLSRTTVYNTLRLFCESGLACAIPCDGGETRFDARVGFHAHFQCRVCGRVSDVEPEFPGAPCGPDGGAKAAGCQVESAQLLLRGVCPACLRAQGA